MKMSFFENLKLKEVPGCSGCHIKRMYGILQRINSSLSSSSLSPSSSLCPFPRLGNEVLNYQMIIEKNIKCFLPVVDYWESMAKGWTHET